MKFKKLKKLNGAIAERLKVSLGSDLEILADQVAEGHAELWECDGGDAYMITRVDFDHLVVCCYEGKNVKHAVPHLIDAAKKGGQVCLRFHTKRESLARLLKDYKPVLTEYVYTIDCSGETSNG